MLKKSGHHLLKLNGGQLRFNACLIVLWKILFYTDLSSRSFCCNYFSQREKVMSYICFCYNYLFSKINKNKIIMAAHKYFLLFLSYYLLKTVYQCRGLYFDTFSVALNVNTICSTYTLLCLNDI